MGTQLDVNLSFPSTDIAPMELTSALPLGSVYVDLLWPTSQKKCGSCKFCMSSVTVDMHTVCFKCRGFDCDIDSLCNE